MYYNHSIKKKGMCDNYHTSNTMNIVYHSSDSYTMVLGISIASLLENNKDINNINIYIVEDSISLQNKEKLKELVKEYERTIVFIPMPDINKSQNLYLKAVRSDWIFNSYCRVFLDQILPVEIEKVLYLDSDVLVLDSLFELWNLDLQGNCVGAVVDCLSKNYCRMLKLSDNSRYCNSGVILQDLKEWRRLQIGKRIKEYVQESGGYVFFMEQTAFNFIFQEKIYYLSPEYNVYTLMQCLSYNELIALRHPQNYYTEKEIERATSSPKIVHLTNFFLVKNRVWYAKTNHPMKLEYMKYKKMTPWKETPDFDEKRISLKKIVFTMVRHLPNRIVIPIINLIYNNVRVIYIKLLMTKAKTIKNK